MCRALVLKAAWKLDRFGNKVAREDISMIKVAVPDMANRVVDRAIQVYGGAGLCQDTPLAAMFARTRAMRIYDGPDEVHRQVLAKAELARHVPWPPRRDAGGAAP